MAEATTTHARKLEGALLGIHALTSLHAGTGTALGVIDLTIQRERHTGWPMVASSTLKGILRDSCREGVKGGHSEEYKQEDGKPVLDKNGKPIVSRSRRKVANEDDAKLTTVFGPGRIEGGSEGGWAGALNVTDARILAFPVRSLKGVFAWVTCHGVIDRFVRDADSASLELNVSVPQVEDGHFVASDACPCVLPNDKLVLEESDFSRLGGDPPPAAEKLAQAVAALLPTSASFNGTRTRFQKHLVVLSDGDFTHFVRRATEVAARIGLDYETKTVKKGALFYQEFLPPETVLYAVLLADESRAPAGRGGPSVPAMTAAEVLQFVKEHQPKVLQIGGDETTGKGLCAVNVCEARKVNHGGSNPATSNP